MWATGTELDKGIAEERVGKLVETIKRGANETGMIKKKKRIRGKASFDDERKRKRARVKKHLSKFLKAKIRKAPARLELVEEKKELKWL